MKKTIIVNKKTEEQFVSYEEHIDVALNGASKNMFTLTREDGTTKEVSESTFKRWYKTVDVEIEEVEIKNTKKSSKKSAKSFEDQKWGLEHTRITADSFCKLFDFEGVEYNEETSVITMNGAKTASRRANTNPITDCVWFRYKNTEYELTDVK